MLDRIPNMLPDTLEITNFGAMLAQHCDDDPQHQLIAVQEWAVNNIGSDARAAEDWVTIIRVLRQVICDNLEQVFSLPDAWKYWRALDPLFFQAIVETSRLANSQGQALLLEHTVRLRQQMEKLEQTKTNFVSVAAHELRTPLTIIDGYARILRAETNSYPHLKLYVDGLEDGTSRMDEIIGDLIDVSLIDLQRIELNYQAFYLERIILMVADSLDDRFAARNVALIIMPIKRERRILGDSERLFNAFSKIIMNALKYTPDGGRVTVTTFFNSRPSNQSPTALSDTRGYVDIQITDNGIGINPENLELIFSRFGSFADVNLHSSGKAKFMGDGPGLGLPIAKGIIEAHGGRIWAESKGRDDVACPGSTFHIEMPLLSEMPDVGS